jgi:hypothetical protein
MEKRKESRKEEWNKPNTYFEKEIYLCVCVSEEFLAVYVP